MSNAPPRNTGTADLEASLTAVKMRSQILADKAALLAIPRPWLTWSNDCALSQATGRPARLYRTDRATPFAPPILHLHGGGWAVGSMETHHALLANLARTSGRDLFAIHPRQVPEHPFPQPLDDCLAAIFHMANRFPDGFVLSGDSAGAHLALSALIAQPTTACKALGLAYGCYRRLFDTDSHHAFGSNDYGLSTDNMRLYWNWLAPLGALSEPISPDLNGLTDTQLQALPPVVIADAALDPLLDDGAWLAARLASLDHLVQRQVYAGMTHSFLHLAETEASAQAALEYVTAFFDAVTG